MSHFCLYKVLTPSAVLITHDLRAKISDFGLAMEKPKGTQGIWGKAGVSNVGNISSNLCWCIDCYGIQTPGYMSLVRSSATSSSLTAFWCLHLGVDFGYAIRLQDWHMVLGMCHVWDTHTRVRLVVEIKPPESWCKCTPRNWSEGNEDPGADFLDIAKKLSMLAMPERTIIKSTLNKNVRMPCGL